MKISVTFCSVCCLFVAAASSPANAQMTASDLLRNSVEQVDDRYKDVADAIVMFQRKNPAAAMGLLNKAAAAHSELPPAEVLYAHLCFGASNVDAGRAVLEIAAVKHADDPEPWVMLADLAMRAGRLAEADVLFQVALEKCDGLTGNQKRQSTLAVNSYAGLARVDERRGQWADAAKHLNHWLELQPENTGAKQRLAAAFFSQKKFAEAYDTLQQIQKLDDKQPLPEVIMGVLHQKSGQQAESERMMQDALKKGADDPVTRMAIAEWALTAGKTKMAQENAAAVLKLNANSVRAQILQGRVKRFEGDAAGAETIFRKIYDQSPANFVASNELALSLFAQEKEAGHKQGLQYAQVNAGRYKDLRTARGRGAAATFAFGLLKVGQIAAAEKIIQQVITSGEVSPQIGYFAAVIYHDRGRLDVAKQLLEKSLVSYIAFPEHAMAQQLLDVLEAAEKATDESDP